MRPSEGHRFNPDEAADRPLREGDRRARRLGQAANVLPYVPERPGGRRPRARRRGRRAGDPEVRRHRRRLRLGGRPPSAGRRWTDTVIYETHVKGFTMRHPGGARGPARHLRRARLRARDRATCTDLGVTAVELLPVHHIADESVPVERGLTNYWGYSSIGYLAPHAELRGDRTRAASRCASSRGWSRRSTAPGSR